MSSTIKIMDNISNKILFEFPLHSQKDAYDMAAKLEAMDMDVNVEIPSVLQQLAQELGSDPKKLGDECQREIDAHNS